MNHILEAAPSCLLCYYAHIIDKFGYEPKEVSTISALAEKCRHSVGKLPTIKEKVTSI